MNRRRRAYARKNEAIDKVFAEFGFGVKRITLSKNSIKRFTPKAARPYRTYRRRPCRFSTFFSQKKNQNHAEEKARRGKGSLSGGSPNYAPLVPDGEVEQREERGLPSLGRGGAEHGDERVDGGCELAAVPRGGPGEAAHLAGGVHLPGAHPVDERPQRRRLGRALRRRRSRRRRDGGRLPGRARLRRLHLRRSRV